MAELILHHYDFSNFSEKIRLVMGLKDLSWYSVEIPAFAPKPDYTPLTGGYRRTPALQIGADVFCDTHLIADTLEKLAPARSLFPGADPARVRALGDCLSPWAEGSLLWPLALYISGMHADRFPTAFHQDRARLHGKPAPDLARVRAAAKRNLARVRVELPRLDALVPDATPFLCGDAPSLADLILYHPPWLLEAIGGKSELIEQLPKLRPWMNRVKALGHGHCTTLAAHEALDRALAASPKTLVPRDDYVAAEDVQPGDPVTVSPMDEVSPATGVLCYVDDERIVLRTRSDRVGEINVHFPRSGYRLRRDHD